VRKKFLNAALLLLTALMTVLSVLRWKILAAAIASLVSFPFACLEHYNGTASLMSINTADYWLAAIVWIGLWSVCLHSSYRLIIPHAARHPVRFTQTQNGTQTEYLIGLFLLAGAIAGAAVAPILAPVDPLTQGDLLSTRMKPPLSVLSLEENDLSCLTLSFSPGVMFESSSRYLLGRETKYISTGGSFSSPLEGKKVSEVLVLLGTDDYGRDVFSRLLYGARYSLDIGMCVLALSLVAGTLIGFSAGYFGGMVDSTLMRLCDLLLSIPPLFTTIALMSFLGSSIPVLILILGATGWMGVARIIRGEVLHLRTQEYIIASELLGVHPFRIMRDHLFPNALPILVTVAVLQLGNIVLAEASLSFLGLGIRPPTPSWGNMIGDSLHMIESGWWMGVFPGIALSALLISLHFLSDRNRWATS
jgi:peptide/nickel transport system permease protein